MAGDWIKIKANLHLSKELLLTHRDIGMKSSSEMFFCLYRAASWFAVHGDYGRLKCDKQTLDDYVDREGFADVLERLGWLEVVGDYLIIHGFCDISRTRKSLGEKVRNQVLAGGKCLNCGSTEELVVDHIIPIVRGGTSEIDNLQPLCRKCNISKGQKNQEEWGGNV